MTATQLRSSQLEQQVASAELRLEQLEEAIRLQGQTEANKLENFDQVNDEVARLRGSIEVLQFEVAEVKRAVEETLLAGEGRQLHDEMRLSKLEKFLGVEPPPPPTAADLGLEPQPEGTEPAVEEVPDDVPDTAGGKLELAATHMEAGRQGVARAILKGAVEAHAGAKEMSEIRYRLAETYFNEEDWRVAIREFNKVINNHAGSSWACWSYYRQGQAFAKMGQTDGAKAFYRGATEGACKNSAASKEAKKEL